MASTISTSGIASGSVIKAQHALRIINSLNGTANNDIYVTGSVGITGSLSIKSGSLAETGSGFDFLLAYDTGSGDVKFTRRNSTSGTSGTSGSSGSSGTSGSSGSSGTSGTNGSSGSSGSSGTSGTNGTNGSSGTSGSSGSSGTSGEKGGVEYNFDNNTSDADPGNGEIKYNNASIASVTFIYIDNLDQRGADQTAWYATWDDSTNSADRGQLIVTSRDTGTVVNSFKITGAVTAATGYYKIPVAYITGTIPSNGNKLSVQFSRSGNAGTSGTSGTNGSSGTSGGLNISNNVTGSLLLASGSTSDLNGAAGLKYTGSIFQITGSETRISSSVSITGSNAPALRVSGSTTLTGSVTISGSVSASNVYSIGDAFLGTGTGNDEVKLVHAGDTDTYLLFDTNHVNLVAGDKSVIKYDQTLSDKKIMINNTNADLDTQIMADNGNVIIHVDAGDNRVGINKTTPNNALDVKGGTSITGSTTITGSLHVSSSNIFIPAFRVTGSTTLTGSLFVSGGMKVSGSNVHSGSTIQQGSIRLKGSAHISGSEAISGSLLITGSNAPALRISGSTALTGSLLQSGSTQITGSTLLSGSLLLTGSSTLALRITGSTALTGSLLQSGSTVTTGSVEISGSLGVGTAASGVIGAILAANDVVAFASSDERLKENITLIENPLDKIIKISGYEYDWVPMEGVHVHSGHDIGVIAQEVEKVFPEIVADRDNGYKAVKYEKLVSVLIEGIKELKQEVDLLKKKING